MLLVALVIQVCALLWSYSTGDRTESQGGYWLKCPEALRDFGSQEGEESKWVRSVVPNIFGIRNWFYGRQIFHGPDGFEWGRVAVNIEALLPTPPLISCCEAWFLIGHRWVPVHVLGVGDPRVRSFPFSVNIWVSLKALPPPSFVISDSGLISWNFIFQSSKKGGKLLPQRAVVEIKWDE